MTDREKDDLFVAEFRERVAAGDPAVTVFGCVAEAVVRELDRLQLLVADLQARVGAQAWLLAQKAERREM